MNPNVLIAVLEIKGVITRQEAERLSENQARAVQPTHYIDARAIANKLVDAPAPVSSILPPSHIGPEQAAEFAAAQAAPPTPPPVSPEPPKTPEPEDTPKKQAAKRAEEKKSAAKSKKK